MKTIHLSNRIILIDENEKSLPINTWVWNDEDNSVYQTTRAVQYPLTYPHTDRIFQIIATSPKLGDLPEFETLSNGEFKADMIEHTVISGGLRTNDLGGVGLQHHTQQLPKIIGNKIQGTWVKSSF